MQQQQQKNQGWMITKDEWGVHIYGYARNDDTSNVSSILETNPDPNVQSCCRGFTSLLSCPDWHLIEFHIISDGKHHPQHAWAWSKQDPSVSHCSFTTRVENVQLWLFQLNVNAVRRSDDIIRAEAGQTIKHTND